MLEVSAGEREIERERAALSAALSPLGLFVCIIICASGHCVIKISACWEVPGIIIGFLYIFLVYIPIGSLEKLYLRTPVGSQSSRWQFSALSELGASPWHTLAVNFLIFFYSPPPLPCQRLNLSDLFPCASHSYRHCHCLHQHNTDCRRMEFSERRRSRKSQSYKLVNEDYHSEVYKSQDYSDINGESLDFQHFSGDEGMEIKKQITGMRRLLNDSTGRIYQRVGKEGEKLKEGVHDLDMSWTDSLSTSCATADPIHSTQPPWNNVPIQTSEFSGQYGTRSKTVQNQMKNPGTNGELRMVNSVSEAKCCTCNCQPTLQAILQELKAMRKFMQVQAVAQTRQQTAPSCLCSQKTILSRKRILKKKVLPKNTTLTSVHSASVREHKPLPLPDRSSSVPQAEPIKKEDDHVPGYGIVVNSSSSDPDVQLAEGFDVFMPKSQLDSILSNYKRSGSLLFRKLVCAFFDDKTLATSLPNGKRKRGLNDNRQGLDQNIVGAIKVFTEKYCTANNVEKVPGPRHWVQILQDQIKLARRRLKRGCDLGNSLQTTDDEIWLHSKAGF